MELGGKWVATEATDDIRRFGIGPESDDAEWSRATVPGHWQHDADFRDSDGPLMYRHRFSAPPPDDGRRRWITFDGIFYQADAWLDGAYLGDSEGYFQPHTFDVTQLSRIEDEHVLAVEVTCAPARTPRSNITGVLQAWDGLPEAWNPGGIWRSVTMYDTGPVRIDRMRVVCRDADERLAHVMLAATLNSDAHHEVAVVTRRDGEIVDEQRTAVALGANEFEWSLDIRDPDLWWPRELGDQPLTRFEVEVIVDGASSDSRAQRTGLRQISWNDWIFSVNGERLFLRGANLMPITVGLADTDDAAIERDLSHVIDLGLNALRVNGHISRRRLYERTDELGLMVLQDFPLSGRYARTVRNRAVEQAAAAVDLLGRHPSIALWSAHGDRVLETTSDESDWASRVRRSMTDQVPALNARVLDRWVKRTFERCDPTRPAVELPQSSSTPERFVTEFGTASTPDSPELQTIQTETLVRRIERFRRMKYRPTGGFCFSALAEPAPAMSRSILDHERRPKLAYDSVRRACAPVLVVIDAPPPWVTSDDHLDLGVYVVNDRREALCGLRVDVVARWAGGTTAWAFGGDVEADDVVRAGSVELRVPVTLGKMAFTAVVTDDRGNEIASNHVSTAVTVPPGV